MKSTHPYFKEEQRFNQWWLKLVMYLSVLVALGPMYYGTIVQLSTGVSWGNKPASNTSLLLIDLFVTLLMAGSMWLVFGSKLVIEIKGDGIHVRFKPFLRKEKFILPEQIQRFEVMKYSPITDYGGWGIKSGTKGKVLNVSGNIGLLLVFKDGKKLMIGTQRPEAIKRAMNKMMKRYE